MGNSPIDISIVESKELRVNVKKLFDRYRDMSRMFKELAREFYKSELATFNTVGAFEGKMQWKPLSIEYAIEKKRKFPNSSILVRTGALKRSMTNPNDSNALFEIKNDGLKIGSKIKTKNGDNLLQLHQKGTNRMPQRKVMQFSNAQKIRWREIIKKHLGPMIKDLERT